MKRRIAQFFLFLANIVIVVFAFLLVAKLKDGTRRILADFEYWRSLFAFTLIWIGAGFWGLKYSIKTVRNSSDLFKRILKCDVFAVAVIYTLMFVFRKFSYSRGIVLGTIFGSVALEVFVFVGLYLALRFNRESSDDGASRLITRSNALENSQRFNLFLEGKSKVPLLDCTGHKIVISDIEPDDQISQGQWLRYLAYQKELLSFAEEYLDLSRVGKSKVLILNSANHFNVQIEAPQSRKLFINLHKLNDVRRVNLYLIKVNEMLEDGGVFICHGQTVFERRNQIYRQFTPYLGVIIYFLDFMFRRVMPKLPILQGWYFALTKGRNRALSETEMLGRLYFCGFELIHKREINGTMHFILKKIQQHRTDPNPTYGPLIRLKRLGQNGKVIYIKKLRTMHPYSEYLQEYVYKTSDLQDGGKFKNDFRVTTWGRVLRALWIDELPQLHNFLKGEVSLVGVRALSEHYFSLYPKEMQELRLKLKPGLMPPFYTDMPSSFEEIVESERRYILAKMKKPLATDFKYFWIGVWNIIVKRARSN